MVDRCFQGPTKISNLKQYIDLQNTITLRRTILACIHRQWFHQRHAASFQHDSQLTMTRLHDEATLHATLQRGHDEATTSQQHNIAALRIGDSATTFCPLHDNAHGRYDIDHTAPRHHEDKQCRDFMTTPRYRYGRCRRVGFVATTDAATKRRNERLRNGTTTLW